MTRRPPISTRTCTRLPYATLFRFVQYFNLVINNAPGEQSWPITATNFFLMYEQPANPKPSAAAREFFTWALENGQQQAAELDYVPLPPELVGQIEQYWAAEFKSAP